LVLLIFLLGPWSWLLGAELLLRSRLLVLLARWTGWLSPLFLLLRLWLWNFNHNVGWLAGNFGLETFFGVSGVGHSSDKAVRINDRVAALDDTAVSLFLAILVVCEFVVLDVKSKLVRSVVLQESENTI
jgi:hypothetical protein